MWHLVSSTQFLSVINPESWKEGESWLGVDDGKLSRWLTGKPWTGWEIAVPGALGRSVSCGVSEWFIRAFFTAPCSVHDCTWHSWDTASKHVLSNSEPCLQATFWTPGLSWGLRDTSFEAVPGTPIIHSFLYPISAGNDHRKKATDNCDHLCAWHSASHFTYRISHSIRQ